MVLRLGDTWYGAHFIGELAEITRIKVEAREFFLRLAAMQTMRAVWPAMCPQDRCVVILSNDVRSEAGFADLVGSSSALRRRTTG